jgi:hypothetical protein
MCSLSKSSNKLLQLFLHDVVVLCKESAAHQSLKVEIKCFLISQFFLLDSINSITQFDNNNGLLISLFFHDNTSISHFLNANKFMIVISVLFSNHFKFLS